MRIQNIIIALVATMGLGSAGCTAFGYPTGSVYTGTQVPHGMMRLEGAGSPKPGDKTGQSCATGILGIAAFGDATLASAKKAGGITDVHSVEFGGMSILGIYTQGCTIVYGSANAAPPPPPPPPPAAAPPPPPPPAAAPPPPPPRVELKGVRMRNATQMDLGSVDFDSGKASIIMNASTKSVLNTVLDVMKNNKDITTLSVEGNTDNAGEPKFDNTKLSQDRSQAVVDWLVKSGIDKGRLSPVGVGSARPLAPNDSPAHMAENRRVEFHVLGWKGHAIPKEPPPPPPAH
jgi:outer membrane protein OmpA-like peptidoglycan-associated protein